jgi:aerobic carbon-monoxide dehydrogenase medium subunit
MYAFDYVRPNTLAAATAALKDSEARALAGGMTLLPTLKLRLAAPSQLVDLSALEELKGVRVEKRALSIGALTCHADVAASADIRRALPALAALAAGIGDAQVRNRGTIGGSVANNDPAADYPAAVLALNATIRTDRREIGADLFFRDLFSTALEPGELIREIVFPLPKRAGYSKFRNPASLYAMVGVFVADTDSGIRVAVTGAGSRVSRSTPLEQALGKSFTAATLAGVTVPATGLTTDLHGSAEYRAHLIPVVARRAVAAALA